MEAVQIPDLPAPIASSDQRRWKHTRGRRQMLEGTHENLVQYRVLEHLGPTRAALTGPPDMSGDLFGVLCRELATLYLSAPVVRHALEGGLQDFLAPTTGALAAAGLWSIMLEYQRKVIGLQEYVLRVNVNNDGHLRFRPVAPDLVVATSPLDAPDQPDSIAELRLRHLDKNGKIAAVGKPVWAWDVFDIRDPENPVAEVRIAETGKRLREGKLLEAAELPMTADGQVVLPYVVHHSKVCGDRLWDSYAWRAVVEGSLDQCVDLSFWRHILRDCSWPQRVAMNCQPEGEVARDEGGHETTRAVVSDPGNLLVLVPKEESLAATFGSFEPGGDPLTTLEAISMNSARVAQDAGISASDFSRTSGDPRSGYALSLSNEGKRAAQRRFTVPFRQADQRVVALAAVMLNWATGSKLPESGYSVIYREIPLSPEELKARREHHLALLDAGMITRERAYQEIHPGTTEAEAKRDLAAIAAGQDLSAMSPEDLALMLQKIYLSVGVVVTPEEARVLMNKAGAGLTGPPPVAANTPRPGVATPEDDNTNG